LEINFNVLISISKIKNKYWFLWNRDHTPFKVHLKYIFKFGIHCLVLSLDPPHITYEFRYSWYAKKKVPQKGANTIVGYYL